jgi:hypothetical protein
MPEPPERRKPSPESVRRHRQHVQMLQQGKDAMALAKANDERLDVHSDSINSLEQWRDGNGAPGAEERIRHVENHVRDCDRINIEPRLNELEANVKIVQRISDSSIQDSVSHVLERRERTAIAKLKAWGPIIAASLVFLATVAQIILGHVL